MTDYLIVSIDYETRSKENLITKGAPKYFAHPTTDVICCSYLLHGAVQTWLPDWVCRRLNENFQPFPFPRDGFMVVDGQKKKIVFSAWNSAFDRECAALCIEKYDWPEWTADIDRWVCTSATSRANSLPAALDNAAKALKIPQKKMQRGKELIKLLSIPQPDGSFNEDPALLREMIAYCEQDVIVELNVSAKLRPLTPTEWLDFRVNERINQRGTPLDIPFAQCATRYAQAERDALEKIVFQMTSGYIDRPTQHIRLKKYVLANKLFSPKALRMCQIVKTEKKGERFHKKRIFSLDKNVRIALFDAYESDKELFSAETFELLQLFDFASKSSVSKYQRMLDSHIDERIHGVFMFAGAMATGRFSSRSLQLHNLVRASVKDFDAEWRALEKGTADEPIVKLSTMLRQTIKAPKGKLLAWGDYSNIEGRILPWLANTKKAREKIKLFAYCDAHRDEPDMYERAANDMALDTRDQGKVCELSLGFGGGGRALQAMGRNYGVQLMFEEAEDFKDRWRTTNSWAPTFWRSLQDAAMAAMLHPNHLQHAGRIRYLYTPDYHNGLGTLWCQLPSGRMMAYSGAEVNEQPLPWAQKEIQQYFEGRDLSIYEPLEQIVAGEISVTLGDLQFLCPIMGTNIHELTSPGLAAIKASVFPAAGSGDWPKNKLYGGLLAENVTQAAANDILRGALRQLDRLSIPVVAHVHDEVVIEVDDTPTGRQQIATFHSVLNTPPEWLTDFPLVADLNVGERYTK